MRWEKYSSIRQLPSKIWSKVAENNPCLSLEFMTIVEEIHNTDTFRYWVCYNKEQIAGVFFYYIKDLVSFPLRIRKLLPSISILMTGTYETYGKHYWFDISCFTEQGFLDIMTSMISKEKSIIYVVRDFVEEQHKPMDLFLSKKYFHICPYSTSWLHISSEVTNLQEYLYSLYKKHRNMYLKFIRQRQIQRIKFDYIDDYRSIISSIYPLYLSVNKNAKEFKTPPLPISFFEKLTKLYKSESFLLIMKVEDSIAGFVLIIQGKNEIVPFLMGIDYSYRDEHVWHNLVLECINYAITTKKEKIDLGLTNFLLKKRLGASKVGIHMYARFKNTMLNKILGKYIYKLI